MAKIIPFEGSSTVPHTDRDNIGSGYREKLDLAIKHKCIYALWNNRGSIFNMGFKFNCAEDLQALKNMEPVYKEECYMHQFIIPFKTTVWSEDNLPPMNQTNTSGNSSQTPQQNNSGLEQNNQNNAQQDPAPSS